MRRYQIIAYFDVTQNSDGIWGIGSREQSSIFIDIDSKTTPKSICQRLKSEGYLESADLRKVIVSDLSSDIIEVKLKKEMKPVCRLEIVRHY